LEGGFISRDTLGAVGALWRSASCRCNWSIVGQSQLWRNELHILCSKVH
jgi:hypothetical protein